MNYRKKNVKLKIKKIKPKKHFYKMPFFWYFLLGVVVFIVFVYLFLFLPQIQISNIHILGNQKINSEDILDITKKSLNKKIFGVGNFELISKSYFLASTENIKKNILKNYPQIKNINVNKKVFSEIKIDIKERVPFAKYCIENEIENNCWLFDEGGVVFEKSDIIDLPIVKETNNDDIVLGEKLIDENIVLLIGTVQNILKDYNIVIKEIFVDKLEVAIKTSELWQIKINLEKKLEDQTTKLKLLLLEEISEQKRKNIEYIDLRFKDRVYYK